MRGARVAGGMTNGPWHDAGVASPVAGWARWPVQTLYSLSGGLTGMGCAHPRGFSQAPTEDEDAQAQQPAQASSGHFASHFQTPGRRGTRDGDSGHLAARPWGPSDDGAGGRDSMWQAEPGSDRGAEEAEPPGQVAGMSFEPGDYMPTMSEPSALLTTADVAALAAAVPLRHRWRRWHMVYSSGCVASLSIGCQPVPKSQCSWTWRCTYLHAHCTYVQLGLQAPAHRQR